MTKVYTCDEYHIMGQCPVIGFGLWFKQNQFIQERY